MKRWKMNQKIKTILPFKTLEINNIVILRTMLIFVYFRQKYCIIQFTSLEWCKCKRKVINASNQNKGNIAKGQLELKRGKTWVPISNLFKSCIWLVEKVAWVSGQTTRRSKAKPIGPNLLLALNWKSVIAWSKCYQFANSSTAIAMDVLHITSFLDGDQILRKELKVTESGY